MDLENYLNNQKLEIKQNYLNEATTMIVNTLRNYGNTIEDNSEYYKGLRKLAYYIMFYTDKDKMKVINFPTGCGKSTAVNNTISYLINNKDLIPYSGTIILKLTQEDCNETMEAINNITNTKLAYAYHSEYDFENERRKNKIDEEELKIYPIVILTHNGFLKLIEKDEINKLYEWTDKKVNGKQGKYNTYYRDRLIIDEAINNVQFMSITIKTINILENAIMNLGNEDIYNIFNEFIMKIKREFLKPYDLKKNRVFFCTFDDIKVPNGLDEAIYELKDKQAKEAYLSIITMLNNGGFVSYSDKIEYKNITTYKYINIDLPYFYEVILDATSSINYLYKINPKLNVVNLPQIKSYKNVHLNIFNGLTGSAYSIKEGFQDGLLETIVEDIENRIVDEDKILIVVNNADREKELLNELKGYERIDQIDITHFGLTVGSNKWSKFTKIFILGIQLMPEAIYPLMYFTNSLNEEQFTKENFNSLDTTTLPIKGNKKYKQQEFEKVKCSVISSLIVQTLNRIHCRACVNGESPETYAYFINRDKEIDNLISQAMPNIQISYDWNLKYTSKSKNKIIQNKKEVDEILINFFEKVRLNQNYRKELIDNGVLTDKGLNKAKIKELLQIKTTNFKKYMKTPLMLQYIKDKNLDVESNNRYIKIK